MQTSRTTHHAARSSVLSTQAGNSGEPNWQWLVYVGAQHAAPPFARGAVCRSPGCSGSTTKKRQPDFFYPTSGPSETENIQLITAKRLTPSAAPAPPPPA